MSRLAPRYGMSDVGLKKLCGRHCIPTPGLGHWAKVQSGKTVRRPRLKGDPNDPVNLVVMAAKVHRGVSDSELVLRQKAFEEEEKRTGSWSRMPGGFRRRWPPFGRSLRRRGWIGTGGIVEVGRRS